MKKLSIKKLHLLSIQLQKEALAKLSEVRGTQDKIHEQRGIYLFQTLRRIGFFDKKYTQCEQIRMSMVEPNPTRVDLTVWSRKDGNVRNYILPASWLFNEDNSFIKKARAIMKENQRKNRIRAKVRKLQSKLV